MVEGRRWRSRRLGALGDATLMAVEHSKHVELAGMVVESSENVIRKCQRKMSGGDVR